MSGTHGISTGTASYVWVAPSALASSALIEQTQDPDGKPASKIDAIKPTLVRRSTHNYENECKQHSDFEKSTEYVPNRPEHTRKKSYSRDDMKHFVSGYLMETKPGDGSYSGPEK